MTKKLYRSTTDSKIAGVCGGLGEYFDIDSTLIRVILLATLLIWGSGGLFYIVCWIVMPKRAAGEVTETGQNQD